MIEIRDQIIMKMMIKIDWIDIRIIRDRVNMG